MSTSTASDIRTWAHEQGITVAERGRLSQDVVAAYVKAHNGSVGADKTQSATAKSKPASTRRTTAVKTSRAAAGRPTLVGDPQERPTSDGASTLRAKALEQRVAELEKQVLSLTERLGCGGHSPDHPQPFVPPAQVEVARPSPVRLLNLLLATPRDVRL